MADYKHGTMNTEVQEKTFSGFVTFIIRSAITIIVALILLAVING
ncbi:aa3-type cytochrome c oxidase subunit IV [Oceaniovalibus sp. ACAM 378]|nr:aa3-type cytochrome c oxidase subunit IV [Oceaniovalibus sp. ACAM 378]TYB87122.1 aa3-type cytochrome c oxidase subunit IV [Oceaniovalibus sp. ACAM 378]